jgi:hypothetical protein
MRKATKTTLKNKADKLVSLIVRLRGSCERCDKTQFLQAAHVVGRNNHTLRFDLNNVICLCAGCHRWAHDNPREFTKWFDHAYPERAKYLDGMMNKLTQRKLFDYEKLVGNLQKEYDKEKALCESF